MDERSRRVEHLLSIPVAGSTREQAPTPERLARGRGLPHPGYQQPTQARPGELAGGRRVRCVIDWRGYVRR